VIDDNRLVGIITNQDLQTIRNGEESYLTIRQVMTPAPVVIHPEDTLKNALATMFRHNFNHLPVVETESPNRLAGFITRTDIMRAYAHSSHSVASLKSEENPGF